MDALPVTSEKLKIRKDSTTFTGYILTGRARPGAALTAPLWEISRIKTVTDGNGEVGDKDFCQSTSDPKFVWTDRASITSWG